MSTTLDDYTTHELTAPDPYQFYWGNNAGTAFVGDDEDEDDGDKEFVRGNDNNDDSLGYRDPADFWLDN